MKSTKKVLPKMFAVAVNAMLDVLPPEVLTDAVGAHQTVERFSQSQKDLDVSAISDMLVTLQGCIASDFPADLDEQALTEQLDSRMREKLGTWRSN